MINEYLKPSSAAEALEMKDKNARAYYLGGGTKLNKGNGNFNAEVLISLEKLGLDKISLEGNQLRIGASVTLQKLMDSDDIPRFLKESAAGESNRNIRNASTMGGEIAYGHSCSVLVTGLLALEAQVETAGEGLVSLEEYLSSERKDLILQVILSGSSATLVQRDQRVTANSRPELTSAVSIVKEGSGVSRAIVVMGGVASTPIRLKKVEEGLVSGILVNADAVQDAVQDELIPHTENKERGTYLNYIGGVLAADCVGRAMNKDISGDANSVGPRT